MFESIMERSGKTEVILRRIATASGPVKKKLRKAIKSMSKGEIAVERNENKIALLKDKLENCGIDDGDIVLIHSSIDGLRSLGLSAEELMDFILDLFKKNTVVFAAYPIEPIKQKEIYKYDPKKTLCWTGILPNVFLKRDGVIRSPFPYNTLAAKGPLASGMMKENLKADVPHGKYTPWEFCKQHHAKILFLGTTSRESNTMAIHMVPDIMEEKWPIKDWYGERKYVITIDGEKIEKTIKIQKGNWYQYVNEYKTDRILRDNNYLKKMNVEDIPLEIVPDCKDMIEFLIQRCNQGELMYCIPKKYYKK